MCFNRFDKKKKKKGNKDENDCLRNDVKTKSDSL